MDNITPNDITGIAALDPRYAMKAKEIEGMPLDKQVDALLSAGLDARTASLILKAKLLKDAAASGNNSPVSQQTVAEEVDRAIQSSAANHARRPEGLTSLPMPDNMFQSLPEPSMGGGTGEQAPQGEGAPPAPQGFARGGIVAFAGEGPSLVKKRASDQPLSFSELLAQGYDLNQPDAPYQNMMAQAAKEQEAEQADPARVAALYDEVRKTPSQFDPRMIMASGVGRVDTTREMAPVLADRKAAAAVLAGMPVPERKTIFNEIKGEAQELGLNRAETKGLADLIKQRADLDAWNAKQKGYGLLSAGADVLRFGSDYRLGGGAHQALAAAIVGMGGYGRYMHDAQKEYMGAKRDLDKANYDLESAIDKNNQGLITLTDNRFKDLYTIRNQAQQRVDELDRSIASEAAATVRANATSQLGRLQAAAMTNPGLQYVAPLEALERRRMAANQIKDPAERARELAAISDVEQTLRQQQQAAIGSTTSGFNTLSKIEADRAKARLQSITRLSIAQMDVRGLTKLRQDLAMIPDDPNNPVLHALWLERYRAVKEAETAKDLAADQVLDEIAQRYGAAPTAPTAAAPGGAPPTSTPHEDMSPSAAGNSNVTVQNW
jgi:hypothetical protein